MSRRAAGAQLLQVNAICEVSSNQDCLGGAMQKTRRGFPWLLLYRLSSSAYSKGMALLKHVLPIFSSSLALPTAELCIIFSAVLCVAMPVQDQHILLKLGCSLWSISAKKLWVLTPVSRP